MQKVSLCTVFLSIMIIFFLMALSCGEQNKDKLELKNDMEKVSYSIGANIGSQISQNLKMSDIEINPDILARAISDMIKGSPSLLTDEEMKAVMDKFQAEQMAANEKEMADNLAASSAFLYENASKDGVTTLEDSLQYEVITEGTGSLPKDTDTVRVHYRGSLLNGTEFDNSYDRGEPTQLVLNSVIRGWSEALKLMKVGSKWKVYIPPTLGYGEQGSPPVIPPNSLLIFEVELLEIVDISK